MEPDPDLKDISPLWSSCSLLQHSCMASVYSHNALAQLPPGIQGSAVPLNSVWNTKTIFHLWQKPGSATPWRMPFEDIESEALNLRVAYDDYDVYAIVSGFESSADIEVMGNSFAYDANDTDFEPCLDILLRAWPTQNPMDYIVSVLAQETGLIIDAQDIKTSIVDVHTGVNDLGLCAHYQYKGDLWMMPDVLGYAQSVHSLCNFQPYSCYERSYGTLRLRYEHQNLFPSCVMDDDIGWGLGYMSEDN